MIDLIKILQLVISLSVAYVWIFRYHNVEKEFVSFGLSNVVRNLVGVSKTILGTLLVLGIWYPNFIFSAAILMGCFMIAAQLFHFKVKNPFIKRLPSLVLLLLCVVVAFS